MSLSLFAMLSVLLLLFVLQSTSQRLAHNMRLTLGVSTITTTIFIYRYAAQFFPARGSFPAPGSGPEPHAEPHASHPISLFILLYCFTIIIIVIITSSHSQREAHAGSINHSPLPCIIQRQAHAMSLALGLPFFTCLFHLFLLTTSQRQAHPLAIFILFCPFYLMSLTL